MARLQSEVERLRAEVAELRTRLARAEAPRPRSSTAAANAVRSVRAAELDAQVVLAVRAFLSDLGYPPRDLRDLGFPDFRSVSRLRGDAAKPLNKRGVPAPRGGQWSARQVQRALARHALRGA